jgi:hypothetical protein
MPFAINLIEGLTAAGWEVDLFLWERPLVDYRAQTRRGYFVFVNSA